MSTKTCAFKPLRGKGASCTETAVKSGFCSKHCRTVQALQCSEDLCPVETKPEEPAPTPVSAEPAPKAVKKAEPPKVPKKPVETPKKQVAKQEDAPKKSLQRQQAETRRDAPTSPPKSQPPRPTSGRRVEPTREPPRRAAPAPQAQVSSPKARSALLNPQRGVVAPPASRPAPQAGRSGNAVSNASQMGPRDARPGAPHSQSSPFASRGPLSGQRPAPVKAATKPEAEKRVVIRLNKWNNFEHPETGIVFNAVTQYAIGGQNHKDGSIIELTDSQIAVCRRNGWKYLSSPDLFLRKAPPRTNAQSESDEDEESDEEEEDDVEDDEEKDDVEDDDEEEDDDDDDDAEDDDDDDDDDAEEEEDDAEDD